MVSINTNETVTIPLVFSGNIGEITVSYIKEAIHGLVIFDDNSLFYIPDENYVGNDLIELKIFDSNNNESNSAIISINISSKNYNLFGFKQLGSEHKEELSSEIEILSSNTYSFYKNNNEFSFDLSLSNANDCSNLTSESVDFINVFNNSPLALRSISNYNIDLFNKDCNQEKFNLLDNGDVLVSSDNNFYLLNRNDDVYMGVNINSLSSFSTIENMTFNSMSFKDFSVVDFSQNIGTIQDNSFVYLENESSIFSNYIQIPNGGVYFNNNLEKYYSLMYEENNSIRTRGVFVKNESNVMVEIQTISFSCEEPDLILEGSTLDEIEYFDGKDIEDIEMDSRVLILDDPESYDFENLPSNIDFVAIVEDLETFSSREDIEIAFTVIRSSCTNGMKNLDVSGENGSVLLIDNKIIHSLDSKFNEEVFFNDQTNEEERSIEDFGKYLIIYEY